MSVLLQDLMREAYSERPPLKQLPDIRRIGTALVSYLRHNIGKKIVRRWEIEDRNGKAIVRLYLPLLHHHPHHSKWTQPIILLTRASEKFNAPFRMFGDGTSIGVEFEVNL